jgi:26S proteasome regulatory subunit N10
MICVDNSSYALNGDYTPTRAAAQNDAVNIVCNAKTQQNVESSVGILTTAGDRVEVLLTPTMDLGKMMNEMTKMQVGGTADLVRGIKTAALALKHRQNKNQKQRIVAFVGSPILAEDKAMEDLGKNLKKNSVSLDIISFGEVEGNSGKLEKLLNAVNSNDSSHLLEVPVGPKLLSDVLLGSPIINPDGVPMGGMGGGGGDGMDFGFNADDDPELALALRISREEDRARQAAAQGGGDAPTAAGAVGATATSAPGAASPAADAAVLEALGMEGMEDMDDELRQALLLSLQESGPPADAATAAAPAPAADKPAEEPMPAAAAEPTATDAKKREADAGTESGEAAAKAARTGDAPNQSEAALFSDPAFVQELLTSLPGVDMQDPRIQEALNQVAPQDGAKKDEDKKDSDKKE